MNEPHKLPAERVDALAERLQGALKRRRPRTWVIVVGVLIVASASLALLAWWLRARPVPPRLEVIAFDVVATPAETPQVVAQLVFPVQEDYPPSLLADREILFFDAPAQFQPVKREPQAKAATDAHGRVVVDWAPLRLGQPETVVARYIDAANKQGSNDQASLTAWEPGCKCLLVDVDETLVQTEPAQWLTTLPAAIAPRPGAAAALHEAKRKQYQIAYLTVRASNPAVYPRVRAWVHNTRAEKDRFPVGPVLGRRDYTVTADATDARRALVDDLKARFGEHVTLITRGSAVPGIRTIILDPNPGPPGASRAANRAASWAAVVPLLEAPPKD